LESARVTTRRLSPLDLCDAIIKHNLDTATKFQAFAKKRRLDGDDSWVSWCMKTGAKKLGETISMALQLQSADESLRFQGVSRLDLLLACLRVSCLPCSSLSPPTVKRRGALVSSQNHADSFSRLTGSSHYDILTEARAATCLCGGLAGPGWTLGLEVNGIDVNSYKASVLRLFREGGGKGLNHFYTGEPNSGKSALVRSGFPMTCVILAWSAHVPRFS